MTYVQEITSGPEEYMASLALLGDPVEVVQVDGAALYRVTDDHFVVLSCTEHTHKGHSYLLRVLPPTWVSFFEAVNRDDCFEAFHYGPDLDEVTRAD